MSLIAAEHSEAQTQHNKVTNPSLSVTEPVLSDQVFPEDSGVL